MADKKGKKGGDKAPEKTLSPEKEKPVERGPHTLPDDVIDTKGNPEKLKAGGSIVFRCLEVKDLPKQSHLCYSVKIDGEDKYHTKPAKGDKFDGETLMEFPLKHETKKVAVELNNRGLVATKYLGEVRFNVDDLLSGYPFDTWYALQNKEGKDKKKKGKVHIQILYFAPNTKQRYDEFTKPLISLIARDRLDLFVKKIDDLGGKGNVSDKTTDKDAVTPLCYAAAEGKAGFVKLLVEHGADCAKEVDKEGMTAVHLAAKEGHCVVLRYLLKQKNAPINTRDSSLKNTPLHCAAGANAGEAVAILIQAGADPNVLNGKSDSPLHYALCQSAGAPKSVYELVKGGADVYKKNGEGLACWEVAQRKDLCSSSQTRSQFMKACNVVDPREFSLQEKLPVKQRIEGDGLSTDWTSATQFIVTSQKTIEVTCLLYPENRPEDYQKHIGFCVIKDVEAQHCLPSFQPEGIGFGGSEPFKFVCEPENTYTVCPFTTDKELDGKFGLCFFQKAGNSELKVVAAKKWKFNQSCSGAWKGDTAAGSALPKGWHNTTYTLSTDSDKESDCYVMLAQKSKDVSAIVFDDNRIVPAKFYIGMYIFAQGETKKELVKSSKWHNSKEVYLKCRLGGNHKTLIVVPSTLMPGEEVDYEISAFADCKISLKKNK